MSYFIEDLDINVTIDSGGLPPTASQIPIVDTEDFYTATTVEGALAEAMTTVNTKANQSTTYTKTEVDTALNLKANKVQEAWITPTLINSWGIVSGHLNPAYIKDEFGFVHFRGRIFSSSPGTNAFIMPVGYRPVSLQQFPVSTDTYSLQLANISDNGDFKLLYSNADTYLDISSICYKAEN